MSDKTQNHARRFKDRTRGQSVRMQESTGQTFVTLALGSMVGAVAGEFAKRAVFGE